MRALLFMAVALLIVACIPRSNAVVTGHETQTVRIIIGFSDPEFDYQNPAFLETLERDLAAEITFIQALSGNAALYLCKTRDTEDALLSRLDRLADRHSSIKYAEPDVKRTIRRKTH